jgi:glutathione peroxidase-family protein
MTTVYDFKAASLAGEPVSLDEFKGQVLLIVNTASKCGMTPHYAGLELLYEKYKDKGFSETFATPATRSPFPCFRRSPSMATRRIRSTRI